MTSRIASPPRARRYWPDVPKPITIRRGHGCLVVIIRVWRKGWHLHLSRRGIQPAWTCVLDGNPAHACPECR